MYGPYKMVLISCVAFLILCIGVFVYRYIYPKKKINLLALIILVSILPIISVFRPGDYESGDFNIHVYRAIDFYNSLKEGILMPSWAGNLNATYGYPLFIFLNPLPYYLTALFHSLGISFINSMKLLFAVSFIFSGIFFYMWAKRITKYTFAAFAGAIVYLFTPYHLVDLHFRNAVGEIMVFMFLPLFFYTYSKFQERKNAQWFMITSFVFAFMIFSHQAAAVFSLFIIIPFFAFQILKAKNLMRELIQHIGIVLLSFIYSFYSWFPHIIYPKYTFAYMLTRGVVEFQTLDLLFSPWRYGFHFQGPTGQISHLVGYAQIIILITSFILVWKKTLWPKHATSFALWCALALFLLFMMTPLSYYAWRLAPVLNTAQFAVRLLIQLAFVMGILMIYISIRFKKRPLLVSFFLLLTVGYTILNWGHRRVIPEITDATLIANLSKSTSEGEGFCCMAQPRWLSPNRRWEGTIPKNHIEIISGKGTVKEIYRSSESHTYLVFSNEELTVKENTWYFPGWKLFVDKIPAKLEYTKNKNPGIILFSIPPGLHKIDLVYNDLPSLVAAKFISISTMFCSLILLLRMFFSKKISFRIYKKQK